MDRFVTRKQSVDSQAVSTLTAATTTREQKDKLLLDLLSSNSSTNKNDGWNNYNSSTYTLEEVDKITREKTKPKPFKAGNKL